MNYEQRPENSLALISRLTGDNAELKAKVAELEAENAELRLWEWVANGTVEQDKQRLIKAMDMLREIEKIASSVPYRPETIATMAAAFLSEMEDTNE